MTTEVLERTQGVSGELVLRRREGHLEVISNGAFLISTENESSSRAMISAAPPALNDRGIDVLIGGLGLGYALDEALTSPRVRRVIVVELEPVIVRWFLTYGEDRATRANGDSRVDIVVGDVLEALASHPQSYDLVALDTDNGPEWLVREPNGALYGEQGLRLARDSVRPGGAVVYWSPESYPGFATRLRSVFGAVRAIAASDVVDGRTHDYVMYVCHAIAGETSR